MIKICFNGIWHQFKKGYEFLRFNFCDLAEIGFPKYALWRFCSFSQECVLCTSQKVGVG